MGKASYYPCVLRLLCVCCYDVYLLSFRFICSLACVFSVFFRFFFLPKEYSFFFSRQEVVLLQIPGGVSLRRTPVFLYFIPSILSPFRCPFLPVRSVILPQLVQLIAASAHPQGEVTSNTEKGFEPYIIGVLQRWNRQQFIYATLTSTM